MKLNSSDALKILNDAREKTSHDGWINHSICVGNTASKIAEALNKNNYKLEVDKVKTLGYIHDIGKMVGEFKNHAMNGYQYLKSNGYDDDYCNICLTHSYLNNDIKCAAGGFLSDIPFVNKFIKNHKYTLEEKIINLCDLMCKTKVYTVDKRIIDLLLRYGVYENTQYHIKETYKLKKYFDILLGHNLYDLFPEIKENL